MGKSNHFVFISGFRQVKGRPQTGVDRITEAMHARLAGPGNWFYEKQWDDDFQATAEQIAMRSINVVAAPKVVIVAYSWGVGNGAVRLSKALQSLGIDVNCLFSIDGVYRSPWPLMKWRSMLRRSRLLAPQICIPGNVDHLIYWRQERSIPQGHSFLIEDPGQTLIIPGIGNNGLCRNDDHLSIDNNPEIREEILRRVLEFHHAQ